MRSPHRGELTTSWSFGGLTILSLLVLLSLIWVPELKHYYVPRQTITVAMTERGRTFPSDDVLQEMRSHRMLEPNWQSDMQLIEKAEKLLRGAAEVPGFPAVKIHLPFDPSDLDQGTSLWQLQFSGLIVPAIFIDAYRITGREEYYNMGRDVIIAWAEYESHAWLNRGFLWNDHAVAARARTLADFWSIYRHRPDYRPDVARQIWEFAARTGALLAKPDQYTFATNHGVMQNLGLWQICTAFPSLTRVEEYKQIAFSRLKDEISFYVSPEGVILEHSADYQEFGLFLFGLVLRYTTLLNLDVPPEWIEKYEQAKRFYVEIRRPDGSLPPFGDTTVGYHRKVVPMTQRDNRGGFLPLIATDLRIRPNPVMLYPVSGYAILWDGLDNQNSPSDLSQTVLTWSYYPGHGHKHADELSVLLWARGQDWWTSAGYWPYDDRDRGHAECWEGSNAPHLLGEKCNSNRTATLISALQSSGLLGVEMERQGPGILKIRRLVLHLVPSTWVIVDDYVGPTQSNLQTIWTTALNVRIERGASSDGYMLATTEDNGQLQASFLGPPSMKIQTFRGSREPFVGWLAWDGGPVAANAIVTDQPAESGWAATVWVLDKNPGILEKQRSAATVEWDGARCWKIRVPLDGGSQLISRDSDKISVSQNSSTEHSQITETLEPPRPEVASRIAALRANFQVAAARYPRFRDLSLYRVRASVIGLAFFFLQELSLRIYRWLGGTHLPALRVLALLAWTCLCVWVPVFYLRVS